MELKKIRDEKLEVERLAKEKEEELRALFGDPSKEKLPTPKQPSSLEFAKELANKSKEQARLERK